jgi:DNA-binding response OmpR family regulator
VDSHTSAPVILIVEDDHIVASLLEHTLARRGYSIRLAADGRTAARFIAEQPPASLVLLDVMLPFVDGFELIDQIRAHPSWRDVPVVMLTSKAQEDSVVRALEAGASDYILKPFRPQELVARVRRFVRGVAA